MRKIIIILLSFLVLSSGYATSNSKAEELVIKGYKISPDEYLEIIITDALNRSLNIIPNGGTLDITEHLNSLFATDGGVIDDTFSQVVFSYRIIGNTSDRYKITFDVESFHNDDSTAFVDAYFELQNLRFTYSRGITPQAGEGYETKDGESWVTTNSQDGSESDRKGTFAATWVAAPQTANNIWTARGTVQMAVSSGDYEVAPYGRYTSTVTIKLEGQN